MSKNNRGRIKNSNLLASSSWLYRPRSLKGTELRVAYPAGYGVSLPWPRLARTATSARYRFDGTSADWSNLTAFGPLEQYEIALPEGEWRVSVLPGSPAIRQAEVRRWLERTAANLSAVYGKAPLPSTQLLVVPAGSGNGRSPVPWGQVNRGGGAAVHLVIDQTKSYEDLVSDWTATHEVSHLLLPYLGAEGRWLSEGVASYYQNIARARTGDLDVQTAFEKLHAGLQRGRRNSNGGETLRVANQSMRERGTTMRVYWSGAAFWLQADLALRERGESLDDVLGKFAACHLPADNRWTPDRLVRRLDQLAESNIFWPLYESMVGARNFPELRREYEALGLRGRGSRLRFDDDPDQLLLRRQLAKQPQQSVVLACATRPPDS